MSCVALPIHCRSLRSHLCLVLCRLSIHVYICISYTTPSSDMARIYGQRSSAYIPAISRRGGVMSDYSLAPSGSWHATERQNGCFWLGDSWTDSSACESEVQAAALLVDLPPPPVKWPISVK